MPLFKEDKHTISIYNETKFIIEQYHAALVAAGLVTTKKSENVNEPIQYEVKEGACFDARLLVGAPFERVGLTKVISRGVERVFGTNQGGMACELQPIEFDMDRDIYDFYIEYITDWQAILNEISKGRVITHNLDSKDISRDKINDPHILVKSLIARLVLFILSESSLRIKHEIYFLLIENFIDKITSEHSPFKNDEAYNPLGRFLRDKHGHFMVCFKQSINCYLELNSHKLAIKKIEDFILSIEKIIKKQIIAYWEAEKDSYAFADSTFNGELAKLEKKAKPNVGQALVKYEGKTSEYDSIISYFEGTKTSHPHAETIIDLYKFLTELKELELIVNSVKKLVDSTGWIGFLGGFIRLSSLADYLKTFYRKASDKLDISTRQPCLGKKDKSYHGLLQHNAINLTRLSEEPDNIGQATKKLEDKKLHDMIFRKIASDLTRICEVQQKLKIELIEPSVAMSILGQMSSAAGNRMLPASAAKKSIMGTTSNKKKPPVPPKPHSLTRREPLASPSYSWEGAPTNDKNQSNLPGASSSSSSTNNIDELKALQALFPSIEKDLLENNTDEAINKISAVIGIGEIKLSIALNKMRDKRGNTLLHIMLEKQQYKQCQWIIDKRASVLIPNIEGVTALQLVAQNILADNEVPNYVDLFFSMCDRARNETRPNSESLKAYEVLSILSEKTVSEMHKSLQVYQKEQKDRFESKSWWIKRSIWDFFGQDCTVQRAIEVAKIYFALYQLKDEQNYKLLIKQLNDLLTPSKNSDGSVLHALIFLTLKAVGEIIDKNESVFWGELEAYTKAHFDSSPQAMKSLRDELARQAEFFQTDKEEFRAELERKAAADKAELERKAAADKAELERKAAADKAELERKAAADKAELERKAAADKAELEQRAAESERRMAESERKAAADKAELEKRAAADKEELREEFKKLLRESYSSSALPGQSFYAQRSPNTPAAPPRSSTDAVNEEELTTFGFEG